MYPMCSYNVCRLCLRTGEKLLGIFDKSINKEFVVEEAIHDVLQFKVDKEVGFPWLICSPCLKKLNEFRIFKTRCLECKIAFENGFQKRDIPSCSYWENSTKKDEDKVVGTTEDRNKKETTAKATNYEAATQDRSPAWSEDEIYQNVECVYENEGEGASQKSTKAAGATVAAAAPETKPVVVEEEEARKVNRGSRGRKAKGKSQPRNTTETKKKQFFCALCGKAYSGKKTLKTHIFAHRKNKAVGETQRTEDGKIASPVAKKQRRKFLKCSHESIDLCDESCVVLNQRKKDGSASKKREKVPLQCVVCLEWFPGPHFLRVHLKRVHRGIKTFKCDECGRCYSQRSTLEAHAKIHKGEELFECNECGMKFTIRGNLEVHLRTHTGERPYRCEFCEKAFSQSSILNVHLRTHNGAKPYTCTMCQKPFSHSSSLKRHIRTHTGSKPFHCDVCEKSFADSGTLNKHKRVHNGEKPFLCNECGQRFARSEHLKRHLKTHKQERPEPPPAPPQTSLPTTVSTGNVKHEPNNLQNQMYHRQPEGISLTIPPNVPIRQGMPNFNQKCDYSYPQPPQTLVVREQTDVSMTNIKQGLQVGPIYQQRDCNVGYAMSSNCGITKDRSLDGMQVNPPQTGPQNKMVGIHSNQIYPQSSFILPYAQGSCLVVKDRVQDNCGIAQGEQGKSLVVGLQHNNSVFQQQQEYQISYAPRAPCDENKVNVHYAPT